MMTHGSRAHNDHHIGTARNSFVLFPFAPLLRLQRLAATEMLLNSLSRTTAPKTLHHRHRTLFKCKVSAQTFGRTTKTAHPEGSWVKPAKTTWAWEKSSYSLGEAAGSKVATSQPLVVRVSKHNRPWGHTTRNRRKGERHAADSGS